MAQTRKQALTPELHHSTCLVLFGWWCGFACGRRERGKKAQTHTHAKQQEEEEQEVRGTCTLFHQERRREKRKKKKGKHAVPKTTIVCILHIFSTLVTNWQHHCQCSYLTCWRGAFETAQPIFAAHDTKSRRNAPDFVIVDNVLVPPRKIANCAPGLASSGAGDALSS